MAILCGLLAAGCVDGEQAPGRPSYSLFTAPTPLPITPPTQQEVRDAIDRGVQYLLGAQLTDGSFGTSLPRFVHFDMPNCELISLKTATTGLCLRALIENYDGSPEMDQAITRAEDWLLEKLPGFRRPNMRSMFNIWGHTYALEALVASLEHRPLDDDRRRRIGEMVDLQIHLLTTYRTLRGGWGYYPYSPQTRPPSHFAASFMTAAALIALYDAREAGFHVPQRLTDIAVRAMLKARSPDGSFDYWLRWRPEWLLESNRGPGSLGRTQAANAALRLWGEERITQEVIQAWLNRLIARNGWLSMARHTVSPHTSYYQVAGYYYYYASFYGSVAITLLPAEDQPFYQDQLAKILIDLQETDGAWWDFPIVDYFKGYGTGFALMALHRCLHD